MHKRLVLLTRMHELQELKLQAFSADYDCLTARKGYEHEFIENKEVLELIAALINEMS